MANAFGSFFQLYIYYKMQTYGLPDMFDLACSSGCGAKLKFVKLSPLVVSLHFLASLFPKLAELCTSQLAISSLLLGLVQLFLCFRVYKSPLVQIPLDSHGMPMVQDPETGKPLPLGPDGKPILPAWLRPQVSTAPRVSRRSGNLQGTGSARTSRSKVSKPAEFSDSSSAPDSETEMHPAARRDAVLREKEIGRRRSSRSGRHGSRP